jgi:hypothetical protein
MLLMAACNPKVRLYRFCTRTHTYQSIHFLIVHGTPLNTQKTLESTATIRRLCTCAMVRFPDGLLPLNFVLFTLAIVDVAAVRGKE